MSEAIIIYAAHIKNDDLVVNFDGTPTTLQFDNAGKAEVFDQKLADHVCINWPKSYRMSSFSISEKAAGKGATDRQKSGSGKGFRSASAVKKAASDADKKVKDEEAKKLKDAEGKKTKKKNKNKNKKVKSEA